MAHFIHLALFVSVSFSFVFKCEFKLFLYTSKGKRYNKSACTITSLKQSAVVESAFSVSICLHRRSCSMGFFCISFKWTKCQNRIMRYCKVRINKIVKLPMSQVNEFRRRLVKLIFFIFLLKWWVSRWNSTETLWPTMRFLQFWLTLVTVNYFILFSMSFNHISCLLMHYAVRRLRFLVTLTLIYAIHTHTPNRVEIPRIWIIMFHSTVSHSWVYK